jgi:aspartate aminotransferase-like enzyme
MAVHVMHVLDPGPLASRHDTTQAMISKNISRRSNSLYRAIQSWNAMVDAVVKRVFMGDTPLKQKGLSILLQM